jgi:16S rRNA (guanine1207-N2)-methyltransferase
MTEHYFSAHPRSEAHERVVYASLRGRALSLYTDAGVFSKDDVDRGTQLLVETISVCGTDRVLDVGCGYGPIGIALAKETAFVTMTDINARAVALAVRNAKRNDCANVHVYCANQYDAVVGQQFDVIVTNPPIRAGKAIVYELFSQARSHLVSCGALWFVMHNNHGAQSAITFCKTVYQSVDIVEKHKGFRVVRARSVVDECATS